MLPADETAELQALIDGSPADTFLKFDRNWYCNGTIQITKPVRIDFNGFFIRAITDLSETLDGTSTKRLARRARAHVRILNTGGVDLIDPWIIGAHPNGGFADDAYDPDAEAQHGLDILNSSDVSIFDAVVSDVYGDFCYVGKGSRKVYVEGLHGRRNGRQGIAVSSGADVAFYNLDLDLVRRTMIDLEPNKGSERVERVLIKGATIGEARANFLSCSSAAGHIGDITIRDINSVMPFRSNVGSELVPNRGPFFFQNLNFVKWHGSPLQCCIKVINTQGLAFDSCRVPTQPGRSMKFIKTEGACSNIVVSNCEFPNAVGTVHQDSGPVMTYGNSIGADFVHGPVF